MAEAGDFVPLDPIESTPADRYQNIELTKLRRGYEKLTADVTHSFRERRREVEQLRKQVEIMALTIKDIQDKATALAVTVAQLESAIPAQSAIDAVGKTLDDAQAMGQAALNPPAPVPAPTT